MMIRREPDKVSLHNDAAVMYDELGLYDQAARHFADVVRLQPSSAPAQCNLATALLSSGDSVSAIDHYRIALTLHPHYARAEFGLGRALLATGNPVDALPHLSEATRLTSESDAGVLDVLAAAHAALGQFEQAVRLCDRALALRPGSALAAAIEQRRSLYLLRKSDTGFRPPR
ncbi:MAG: tetratricopeptide repeat protein [Vicinamibacterales bacterium]